jgi:putative ABC transport system permease protein
VLSQGLYALKERAHHWPATSLWTATREAFWIALEALRTHKLRSLLTLLGVVIATTTLIVVMSVINGINLYFAEHMANMGANVFILTQMKWMQGYQAWLRAARRNKPIRMEEYEFLKANLPNYKNIGATSRLRGDARYQGHTFYDVSVLGVTPSMIDIGESEVEYGRYLTESEYEHSALVCFIGSDLVREFFPFVDPLDKYVLVKGLPFRVVGVARRIGSALGRSDDGFVHIPLTTFRKHFVARPQLNVSVQAWNAQQMLQLQDEVRVLMRVRRHLAYQEEDDFGINAPDTIMEAFHRITASIFAGTIGVVAVFMVVGGIVIMNIMLASVTERTHEIGIRKSLGARRRDVLIQFVIESGVMAAAGGVAGVVLAILINQAIRIWIFSASEVSWTGVVIGVTLATVVGLFFGIYPATRAARLDPIEALRTEH